HLPAHYRHQQQARCGQNVRDGHSGIGNYVLTKQEGRLILVDRGADTNRGAGAIARVKKYLSCATMPIMGETGS
ncbi:MAG: hypothetical protein ACREUA_00670, partial [Burkholderiales bacterium]